MREYETIYILRPEAGADAVDAFNAKMKEIIGGFGGKVLRLSNWGKKKLAYRVQKCSRGIYIHILYLGDGGTVQELERNLRLSDMVIRHLTVNLGGEVDPAARTVEADVRLRGDAEDDAPAAAAPAPSTAPAAEAAMAAAAPAENGGDGDGTEQNTD
jgi:small subunit ribosomal protein S6